jgi:hypothetical protein
VQSTRSNNQVAKSAYLNENGFKLSFLRDKIGEIMKRWKLGLYS